VSGCHRKEKKLLLEKFADDFQNIEIPVHVFSRQEDGRYKLDTVDFKAIFPVIENTAYPNLEDWLEYGNTERNKTRLNTMLKRLNGSGGVVKYQYILARGRVLQYFKSVFQQRASGFKRGALCGGRRAGEGAGGRVGNACLPGKSRGEGFIPHILCIWRLEEF